MSRSFRSQPPEVSKLASVLGRLLAAWSVKCCAPRVPLVIFVSAGSWALSKFVQGRVDAKDLRVKTLTERQFSLEQEHGAVMRKLKTDDYEVTRIPRPRSEE